MIAGGEAGPLVDDVDDEYLPARNPVTLTERRLEQVLGADIPGEQVLAILESLELSPEAGKDGWTVTPPSHRFDIAMEDDLVEEVARIYGYDQIPETTATAALPLPAVTESRIESDAIADALVARDFQEVITYSFIDSSANERLSGTNSEWVLSNPISSEMSVMRSSLLPGMLRVAAANIARQQDRVRIFELGNTYAGSHDAPEETLRVGGVLVGPRVAEQWAQKAEKADFFDVKSDVESLLAMSGLSAEFRFVEARHTALQPGQCAEVVRGDEPAGWVGKLHPETARFFDIKNDVFVFELDVNVCFAARIPDAKTISKFPAIRRDLALVVDDNVIADSLIDCVMASSSGLIRDVRIFDVYRGEGIEAGRKSIALGLILQETSRTLTDVDADQAIDAALQKLKQEFNADLRD